MLDNVIVITLLVLLGAGLISAYMRGVRVDACLHSFEGFMTTVRLTSGKEVWGQLDVETTALELRYRKDHFDSQGHIETSSIIYKAEFPLIDVIIRFNDELSPAEAQRRDRVLARSFHPGPVRRLRRRLRNVFNTTKDAVAEAVSVASSTMRLGKGASGAALSSQQKSVSRAGAEVIESFGNVYDPTLEKHIGRIVVLEVGGKDGQVAEYVGVLREYSPEFLEVLDIPFEDKGRVRQADLLVPRLHGFIRHSGEPLSKDMKADRLFTLVRPARARPKPEARRGPGANGSSEPKETTPAGKPRT